MSARMMLALALLVLSVLPVACEKQATPEQVAGSFISAIIRMDIEAAYSLVSSEARDQTPIEKAAAERAKLAGTGLGVILELLAEKTTHEITGTTIDGDTAMVSYTLSNPDIRPILQDPTFAQLVRSKGNDINNLRTSLAARLNQADIQSQSQEKVLSLVREEGKWVVKSFSL